MRRIALLSLCLLAALLSSGCAGHRPPFGLGVDFTDSQGRSLDHPYGKEKVVIDHAFIQNYPGWVAISVEGGPAREAPYGQPFTVSSVSQKYFHYTIYWGQWIGYDQRIHGEEHTVIGLYNGEPIVIDEKMLLNASSMRIVVDNTDGVVGTFYDSQGHRLTVPAMSGVVLDVLSGDYTLSYRPLGDNKQAPTMSVCKKLCPGKKVFWNGQFYDDRIHVDRIRPNSWDVKRMRDDGGCIKLP